MHLRSFMNCRLSPGLKRKVLRGAVNAYSWMFMWSPDSQLRFKDHWGRMAHCPWGRSLHLTHPEPSLAQSTRGVKEKYHSLQRHKVL